MMEAQKNQITELWIQQINLFVDSLDVGDNIKAKVRETLLNQKDLIKSGMITDDIFGVITSLNNKINECNLFFNYLYGNDKGAKYFETAINYSLNGDSNLSFIDNFIRFIVITNYNDIEVVDNVDTNYLLTNANDYSAASGSMRAYLGGFLLGDLSQFSVHQDDSGGKYLDFYSFHTRENLERTKIGTLLIKKMLHKMLNDDFLKDCSLGSNWVMKNNLLGKNFYQNLGFKFLGPSGEVVDYHYYDDFIKVERENYPELSDLDFYKLRNEMGSNFGVVIPSKEKSMIANQSFDYPFVEYNGEKIDCTTSFSQLKYS